MEKSKVTQDELYKYLTEHNFVISLLGKMMGVSVGILMGCFHHDLNRHGKPLKFSSGNIGKLNAVLPQIADELRQHLLTFGSDQAYTNLRGATYDPALIEPINALSKYFNVTAMLMRLLGWKKGKKSAVFCQPSSKGYGSISKADMTTINAELLSVAGVLSSYEVVASECPDKQVDRPIKTKQETSSQELNEWDDTTIDLWERYASFHRLFPDGLIAFSVNDGFTVCEDDARLLARVDTTLQPYTDPATGHVTLYMDAAKWQQMRRAWDDGDEMVAETPMYAPEKS